MNKNNSKSTLFNLEIISFYEMYHGCGLVHEDGTRVVLMQKENVNLQCVNLFGNYQNMC